MKRRLTTLAVLLMLLLSLTTTVYAAEETPSGACGENLTWTLDEYGTLRISGTGAMAQYTQSADVPWNDYRSEIVTVIVEPGVTTIGNYAFYDCGNLTKAELPVGITDIGGRAFYYCKKLAAVNIPQGVTAIGYDAFSQCDSLPELTIPDSVKEIGSWAFAGSDRLTKMVVPDSVVHLGECAFWWCDLLEEVVIGDGVTELGNFTFYNCISLRTVTVGSGVTSICSDVFEGCTNLTEVTFSGDAPTFEGDTVFLGVTAACYYPMGNGTWTESVMQQYGGTLTWTPVSMAKPTITRIAGAGRCETAVEAADVLREQLGVDKFSHIIIANGSNFADALAGSYLAAVKDAPILLYRGASSITLNEGYIKENLSTDGIVYLLGGEAAVPAEVESGLKALNVTVKRLAGASRFDTNIKILEEAGVQAGQEILVATAYNFADSLSASATGKPMLLVNGKGSSLSAAQIAYLEQYGGGKITILGGAGAVSDELAEQLAEYGTVKRLAGKSRYETSTMIAGEYFDSVSTVVIAYGKNFPDGLSGGPVAYAMGAPLVLTAAGAESAAAAYVSANPVTVGYVMGGDGALSNETVNKVFGE